MLDNSAEPSAPLSLRSYYTMLRKGFDGFSGEMGAAVRRIPDLIQLFVSMLADTENVTGKERLWINAAIGYVIALEDVFPESKRSTVKTYVADVFACAHVLRKLAGSLGEEVIESHWDEEGSAIKLADWLYKKARQRISEEEERKIVQYMGLDSLWYQR